MKAEMGINESLMYLSTTSSGEGKERYLIENVQPFLKSKEKSRCQRVNIVFSNFPISNPLFVHYRISISLSSRVPNSKVNNTQVPTLFN